MMTRKEEIARKKKPCRMDGCGRKAECPNSGLCKRCYAWVHYQMNTAKTVTQLMNRLDQINFWGLRLKGYLGETTPSKSRKRRTK